MINTLFVKIISFVADVTALCHFDAFFIDIVLFAFYFDPAAYHSLSFCIYIGITGLCPDPGGFLHGTVFAEIVPVFFDFLPSGDHRSLFAKIICLSIAIAEQPLAAETVFIKIVISAFYVCPGLCCISLIR